MQLSKYLLRYKKFFFPLNQNYSKDILGINTFKKENFLIINEEWTNNDNFLDLNLDNQIGLRYLTKLPNYHIQEKSLAGALISSKKDNFFNEGNNGSCLRDSLYKTISKGIPYTDCVLGKQISIKLLQKHLLNTLNIWFLEDGFLDQEGVRYYDIIVQNFQTNFLMNFKQ